ncbi:unnamed protein product [Lactuca saligna]|uniref:Uncharacterized protein n=1 Tax=Lactuca saligna TaxID=75948 RepID=A0AA35YDV4_LACSI|nr:unnamed protein product [Lactuca saligna]
MVFTPPVSAPTFVAFNHRNRLQANLHPPSFCDTKLIGKIIRMMCGTIRRKALSLCSSAVANNAFGRGSKLVPEIHQGAPVYSKALRDVSSFKTEFLTPKWVRSFSSHSGPTVCGDISEPIGQIQTDKVMAHKGPGYFTASGAVVGSASIVNAPQAAKLGLGSTATSTFLPNLALFWHINNGIEEILADYVHHEMTRSLVLVLMRLFLIVAAKDVFVATN